MSLLSMATYEGCAAAQLTVLGEGHFVLGRHHLVVMPWIGAVYAEELRRAHHSARMRLLPPRAPPPRFSRPVAMRWSVHFYSPTYFGCTFAVTIRRGTAAALVRRWLARRRAARALAVAMAGHARLGHCSPLALLLPDLLPQLCCPRPPLKVNA